jgi:hypothetical protein
LQPGSAEKCVCRYKSGGKRDVSVSDGQSVVDSISNGIAIYNKGLLKLIRVVSENNSIKINLYFEDEKWNESIAFIDFHIDLMIFMEQDLHRCLRV